MLSMLKELLDDIRSSLGHGQLFLMAGAHSGAIEAC
jgi:hypothetical protein